MPIMAAREFHTSASSVNPQNSEGSLGSSFGGSTCNMQSEHLTYHQLSFILFRNWFFRTMCVQKSQVQFNENMNGWESGFYPCGKFCCPCYRKGLSWLWPWTSQGGAHDGSWQEVLHMQSEYLQSCFSSQSSPESPSSKTHPNLEASHIHQPHKLKFLYQSLFYQRFLWGIVEVVSLKNKRIFLSWPNIRLHPRCKQNLFLQQI